MVRFPSWVGIPSEARRACCDQVIVCVGVIARLIQLRFTALFEWFLASYLPFTPVCLATIEYWNHLIHSELSSETVHRRW